MRLSKKAAYALRALAVMAQGKKSWSIQELCDRENIPVKFLEQILLTLRHAGILMSRRGVGGGYTLARPAGEIALADVVQALDGPVAPVPCAAERPTEPCTCPVPATCPVRILMTEFRCQLTAWLGGKTLDDLAQSGGSAGEMAFEI